VTVETNTQRAVESLIAGCNESLQRGKDGGLASPAAYRDAGAALCELKELLPRRQFGRSRKHAAVAPNKGVRDYGAKAST
jgi:hypothetical protein